MVTENLSTLKIHKLTQAQYDRELNNGTIDANALYLTPEEAIDLSTLGVTATAQELNYVDGVTSNIQTQLDSKAFSNHNHAANAITGGNLAGTVRAGTSYQTPSSIILRNSGLFSTDTNPTINGEICWTYK